MWVSSIFSLPTLYGEPFNRGVQARNYVERVQIFTDIVRFYDIHQRRESVLEEGVIAINAGN